MVENIPNSFNQIWLLWYKNILILFFIRHGCFHNNFCFKNILYHLIRRGWFYMKMFLSNLFYQAWLLWYEKNYKIIRFVCLDMKFHQTWLIWYENILNLFYQTWLLWFENSYKSLHFIRLYCLDSSKFIRFVGLDIKIF